MRVAGWMGSSVSIKSTTPPVQLYQSEYQDPQDTHSRSTHTNATPTLKTSGGSSKVRNEYAGYTFPTTTGADRCVATLDLDECVRACMTLTLPLQHHHPTNHPYTHPFLPQALRPPRQRRNPGGRRLLSRLHSPAAARAAQGAAARPGMGGGPQVGGRRVPGGARGQGAGDGGAAGGCGGAVWTVSGLGRLGCCFWGWVGGGKGSRVAPAEERW